VSHIFRFIGTACDDSRGLSSLSTSMGPIFNFCILGITRITIKIAIMTKYSVVIFAGSTIVDILVVFLVLNGIAELFTVVFLFPVSLELLLELDKKVLYCKIVDSFPL